MFPVNFQVPFKVGDELTLPAGTHFQSYYDHGGVWSKPLIHTKPMQIVIYATWPGSCVRPWYNVPDAKYSQTYYGMVKKLKKIEALICNASKYESIPPSLYVQRTSLLERLSEHTERLADPHLEYEVHTVLYRTQLTQKIIDVNGKLAAFNLLKY